MSELIVFLTFLKSIGFEAKILEILLTFFFTMTFFGVLGFVFRKPMIKFFVAIYNAMQAIPKMDASIDNLNKTLQEHIVQTDLRMSDGERQFNDLNIKISNLTARMSHLERKTNV